MSSAHNGSNGVVKPDLARLATEVEMAPAMPAQLTPIESVEVASADSALVEPVTILAEVPKVVPAPPMPRTTIVVPTLNEAGNIAGVLAQLAEFDDIVIVDGESSDGTVELARQIRPDITVVSRPPRGKGDALRAGFAAATGDVVVIMDADGSMDPAEIKVFALMIDVGFDLVKGSRYAVGGGSHDLTTVRSWGNRVLCAAANTMFHTHWTDLCYGYLALRRSAIPRLNLVSDGFEIESEILCRAAQHGLRIAEIPSVEFPRAVGFSHLSAPKDGLRIVRTMLESRFAPRGRRDARALRPLDGVHEAWGLQ